MISIDFVTYTFFFLPVATGTHDGRCASSRLRGPDPKHAYPTSNMRESVWSTNVIWRHKLNTIHANHLVPDAKSDWDIFLHESGRWQDAKMRDEKPQSGLQRIFLKFMKCKRLVQRVSWGMRKIFTAVMLSRCNESSKYFTNVLPCYSWLGLGLHILECGVVCVCVCVQVWMWFQKCGWCFNWWFSDDLERLSWSL